MGLFDPAFEMKIPFLPNIHPAAFFSLGCGRIEDA
jgi:hypothetical protein